VKRRRVPKLDRETALKIPGVADWLQTNEARNHRGANPRAIGWEVIGPLAYAAWREGQRDVEMGACGLPFCPHHSDLLEGDVSPDSLHQTWQTVHEAYTTDKPVYELIQATVEKARALMAGRKARPRRTGACGHTRINLERDA
jgi:hypothetical protein